MEIQIALHLDNLRTFIWFTACLLVFYYFRINPSYHR